MQALAVQLTHPSIVGIVADSRSSKPIPFANVIVIGTKFGIQTDEAGIFKLAVPDTGDYQVQVMAIGFEKQLRSVRVPSHRATTLVFRLKKRQLSPGTVLDTTAKR